MRSLIAMLLDQFITRSAVAGVLCLFAASEASAQVTAVKGIAFTPSPIVTGTTSTVAPNTAAAAVFKIHGILGIGGSFSFQLPTNLTLVGNSSVTMPVTFSSTSASYRFGDSTPGGTVFNPVIGVSGLYIVVLTDIYIFLGASISPPLNQQSGSYTATVVFTSSALL